MADLDWTLFHWLNGQAGQHAWLDQLAKTAATQLALVIVGTLAAGWLLAASGHMGRERRLPRGLLTVVFVTGMSLALAFGVNQVVGHFWFRPRPYTGHRSAHLLLGPSSDPSFASDHATAGFALALGSISELPRTATLLFFETVLMSVGRIYVGLHYPGDILGGLAIAAVTALAIWWVVRRGAAVVNRIVDVVNDFAGRRGWPARLS